MNLQFVRPALTSALAAIALTWATNASATPDFPGVVVQTLGLDAGITIDPPMGCTLCHTTDSGGTSLRSFGQLLLQNGAQPYNEPSLKAALMQVMQQCPQLITDIEEKHDPNNDTCSTQAALPTPEYGCSVRPGGRSDDLGWLLALGAMALFGRRGARR